MKLLLALLLTTAVITQNRLNEEMREEFNVDDKISDIRKGVNDDINQANQDEHKRLMNEFLDDAMENLRTYKKTVKVVEVGEFQIQVQSGCELEMPTPPSPPNPVDNECIRGHYEGEMLAKAVARLTKGNPMPTSGVLRTMAECELIVEKEISFSIYNDCVGLEFGHYYEQYFEKLKQEMSAKGFSYEVDEQGGHKFVKKAEQVIALQSAQTELEVVN